MRGGKFFNTLRAFGRQPVVSTPLIRNAFELGHCVYKPLKHGCVAVPSKQKEYFLIGLSVAMNQFPVKLDPFMKTQIQAKPAATMSASKQEEVVVPAKEEVKPEVKPGAESDPSFSVYWGKQSRPWNSFARPETRSSSNIDLSQKNPETFLDQVARLAVTALRFPTDLLFRVKHLGLKT